VYEKKLGVRKWYITNMKTYGVRFAR
jgi:hypothetical protein